MSEHRYWVLATAREDESGDLPSPEVAISIPWWPEVPKYSHAEGNERVYAPQIFSSREHAEQALQEYESADQDSYLELVEKYGEDEVNEAYDNTAPLRIFGMSQNLLLDKLEDSDFLCVMLDGCLKLRQNLVEELQED